MENPIQTEIKKRKIDYYAVTKDELNSLSERNNYGDLSSIIASLSLSALLTGILTKSLGESLKDNTISCLNELIIISSVIFSISFVLVIIFKLKHSQKIKEIIGDKPVQYVVKEVDEEVNPDYYTGDKRIVMNISLEHNVKFHRLFKSRKEFDSLITSEHSNRDKKDYFTFSIKNGSDKLLVYFQRFLIDNEIDYIDYR